MTRNVSTAAHATCGGILPAATPWTDAAQPAATAVSIVPGIPHDEAADGPAKWIFSGEHGANFRVFVASGRADRERAYRLAHRVYARRGYVAADEEGMVVSPFDERPETFTLLAEDSAGRAAGTVTLVFDSADAGLPCDEIFHAELQDLRMDGKKLAEVIRLAVDEEHAHCKALLVHLFDFIYIYARRVCGYTDFVIEVNPRHVNYYRRLLAFEPQGPERPCPRVGGAPAVLLRMDFAIPEREIRRVGGTGSLITRSVFACCYPEEAELPIMDFLGCRKGAAPSAAAFESFRPAEPPSRADSDPFAFWRQTPGISTGEAVCHGLRRRLPGFSVG